MSYQGAAMILIRCVDVRYSKEGVRQALPGAYDFTYPGASLGVVNDPAWRASLLAQWRELTRLGVTIGTVLIADHFSAEGGHGCKAYQGDDSRQRHEENLRAAARWLAAQSSLRGVRFKLYLHDIDAGSAEVISLAPAVYAG